MHNYISKYQNLEDGYRKDIISFDYNGMIDIIIVLPNKNNINIFYGRKVRGRLILSRKVLMQI